MAIARGQKYPQIPLELPLYLRVFIDTFRPSDISSKNRYFLYQFHE